MTARNDKYWILAGNYRQFKNCCRERNINPKEAIYVSDINRIRGRNLPEEIIEYGTFHDINTNTRYEILTRIDYLKMIK